MSLHLIGAAFMIVGACAGWVVILCGLALLHRLNKSRKLLAVAPVPTAEEIAKASAGLTAMLGAATAPPPVYTADGPYPTNRDPGPDRIRKEP